MSNPAQEEADRFFNYRSSATSHPEDEDSVSDNEKPLSKTIRSKSSRKEDLQDEDTSDEDSAAAAMATMTSRKTSYTLPSTARYANTGPKGVIADAQNYHRAKRTTFRQTLHSLSDTLSLGPKQRKTIPPEPQIHNGNSSDSDIDLLDDDNDNHDFMQQWRQQRLTELQDQFSTTTGSQSRAYPPGRRTYGTLDQVDANGYLDAIEQAPAETNVVVLLFDPYSQESLDVEDELKTMAYRWSHVRFVKLHYEIAEMETMEIPAILAYRGGDVFASIDGAEREGLEDVLRGQGVLGR